MPLKLPLGVNNIIKSFTLKKKNIIKSFLQKKEKNIIIKS